MGNRLRAEFAQSSRMKDIVAVPSHFSKTPCNQYKPTSGSSLQRDDFLQRYRLFVEANNNSTVLEICTTIGSARDKECLGIFGALLFRDSAIIRTQ